MFFSSSYGMCGHRSAFFMKKWSWYCRAAKKWNSLGTGDEALMTSTIHDPTCCKEMEEKSLKLKGKAKQAKNFSLRVTKILSLPIKPLTTTYGLLSLRHFTAKL